MIKNQIALRRLHEEQQVSLLKAVYDTQESERKRLAEDLHDSVGQLLSSVKLNLHRLEKLSAADRSLLLLEDTRKLTDDCIQEIRNIIHNILPPVLTDYGLLDALQALCRKTEQTTGIEVKFTNLTEKTRFNTETELTLYRIAQELFGNAIKHAAATAITLELFMEGDWLVLTFSDNGKGFVLENAKRGFGLMNMKSRIHLLNGTIDIKTKLNHGTCTVVKIPESETLIINPRPI